MNIFVWGGKSLASSSSSTFYQLQISKRYECSVYVHCIFCIRWIETVSCPKIIEFSKQKPKRKSITKTIQMRNQSGNEIQSHQVYKWWVECWISDKRILICDTYKCIMFVCLFVYDKRTIIIPRAKCLCIFYVYLSLALMSNYENRLKLRKTRAIGLSDRNLVGNRV